MPYSKLSWDWKGSPELEDLQDALAPFGVRVYEDPALDGTDSFGYVFSSEPLSRDRLKEISTEDDGD
jgi:hypothetical protein